MKPNFKSWATPLIIATFIISGITGILLFFHNEGGLVKPVHEWLSWALVAGAILHTAAHWKGFTGYFSRKQALAIISIGVIIALASFTVPVKGGHGNPFMKAGKAMASASVEKVAPVANLSAEQALDKLEQKGIRVASSSQSIKAIATANGKKEVEVLEVLFD
jgi:hypothetical protein